MKISLIVARSKNNVIGKDGKIPWEVKGEQLLFKALTYNQCVVMGRKTYQSLRTTLPDRNFIILASEKQASFPTMKHWSEVYGYLYHEKVNHIYIAGGGEVYKCALPYADTIHLSTIDTEIEGGDTFFEFDESEFQVVFEQEFKSNINYKYQIWKRI